MTLVVENHFIIALMHFNNYIEPYSLVLYIFPLWYYKGDHSLACIQKLAIPEFFFWALKYVKID